jgi:hypothetical protein
MCIRARHIFFWGGVDCCFTNNAIDPSPDPQDLEAIEARLCRVGITSVAELQAVSLAVDGSKKILGWGSTVADFWHHSIFFWCFWVIHDTVLGGFCVTFVAVCALELGCWCGCRVPLHSSWSPHISTLGEVNERIWSQIHPIAGGGAWQDFGREPR